MKFYLLHRKRSPSSFCSKRRNNKCNNKLSLLSRGSTRRGREMKTIIEAYIDTKIGFANAKPIFVIIPLLLEQFLRILTGVNK